MNYKKSEIMPGCNAMTYGDMDKMNALNYKNGWAFSLAELERLGTMHKKAREEGNIRRMEMIEYRLEDCNFHTECALLSDGDYEGYAKTCKAIWED